MSKIGLTCISLKQRKTRTIPLMRLSTAALSLSCAVPRWWLNILTPEHRNLSSAVHFLADQDGDDLLRQTEPKAHDGWQPSFDADGIDPDAPEVARAVAQRIKSSVHGFRKTLKPELPNRRDIRLPELEKYLSKFSRAGETNLPRRLHQTLVLSVFIYRISNLKLIPLTTD